MSWASQSHSESMPAAWRPLTAVTMSPTRSPALCAGLPVNNITCRHECTLQASLQEGRRWPVSSLSKQHMQMRGACCLGCQMPTGEDKGDAHKGASLRVRLLGLHADVDDLPGGVRLEHPGLAGRKEAGEGVACAIVGFRHPIDSTAREGPCKAMSFRWSGKASEPPVPLQEGKTASLSDVH